jgi:hypothetical protein
MAVARLRSASSAAARLQPALAGRGEDRRRYLGTATAAAEDRRRYLGTATAAAEVADAVGAECARWEPMGAREYYDYRRAIYGDITHKAILVDAAGTLLAPTEPMAQVRSTPPYRVSIYLCSVHRYAMRNLGRSDP